MAIEDEIVKNLARQIQEEVDDEVIRMMSSRYKEPRVEFRSIKDKPLSLEYALAYYPGCFTPTGLNAYHLRDIKQWCADSDCGIFDDLFPYTIHFRDEKELLWFKLRWS